MNVTDTFNRGDSAIALGTTSDGNAAWVATSGTWGISTNRAYCSGAAGSGVEVATIDGGAGDGTVQVTLAVVAQSGLAFRVQDDGNFWQLEAQGSSGSNLRLHKWSGGSATLVGTFGTVADGDVITAVMAGPSITCKKNGSTVGSTSDSYLAAQTKHGITLGTPTLPSGARWDDFSLATVAPWRPAPIRARRTQALMRAAVR